MNCKDAQGQFDDYRSGGLGEGPKQAFSDHIANCETCRSQLSEQQALGEKLSVLDVEPYSDGFVDRALSRAASVHAERRHRAAYYKGFGSAMAAALMLWVAVGVIPQNDGQQLEQQIVSIALQETRELKLAFHSVKALENATISIELPDNVQLVGYEDRRVLEWQTNLTQGDNVLRLPLRALRAESGQLVAHVKHSQQSKTIQIRLNVGQPGLTERPVKQLTIV